MKKSWVWLGLWVLLLITPTKAYTQTRNELDELKVEAGALFTVLEIDDPHGISRLVKPGVGGRVGYNLRRSLTVEAEINFLPRPNPSFITNFTGGSMIQGLFGVKAGIRRERFGVFGKARPGFESSGGAAIAKFPNGDGPDRQNPFGIENLRSTQFAIDIGGVFESYPSKRTIVRFDLGRTIVRYPGIQFTHIPLGTVIFRTLYRHNYQFSAGMGFRF